MTEGAVFDLVKKARWLHAVIGQAEHDYRTLAGSPFVKVIGGITEFENLPLFLDLAEELAGDVRKISEELLTAFD